MELQVVKSGDDLLIVIPEALRAQLQWQAGDTVKADVAGDGLTLTRTETAHDRAMKIAEKVMIEYHDVFVTLAKS